MANFAQLDDNNVVINVIVIDNKDITINGIENEERGIAYCQYLVPGTKWKQTSYNTYAGKHAYDGVPFRKNYAGIGYTYDVTRDAFIPPKPFNSWILNEDTCLYEAPTPMPTDDKMYSWNEDTLSWVEITM